MQVFNMIVQQNATTTYEKQVAVEADNLEEAVKLAKEEADTGYWSNWEEVGDILVETIAWENDYE